MPIGTRLEPPVDAPDVVARHVRPMLGEVGRRPQVRRTMQAVDESFDDGPREQLEIPDLRENGRIDKLESGSRRSRTKVLLPQSSLIPDL